MKEEKYYIFENNKISFSDNNFRYFGDVEIE